MVDQSKYPAEQAKRPALDMTIQAQVFREREAMERNRREAEQAKEKPTKP